MISGPQGPRVLLDGRPVLLLCSDNHLGLADHPQVREAAAEAAMRYGAGACAPRPASGTMRIHRRLEERLAEFAGHETALLFGSRYLANVGVLPALAGPGHVVLADARNHASSADGVRLSGAEAVDYGAGDVDHLEWALEQATGRPVLVVTDGVFGATGELAPLAEIVELARRHDARVVVDETHGLGAVGASGHGAAAAAGVEDDVDVIVGSLETSLGSYGGFACCDRELAGYLSSASHTLLESTAPAPPVVAAAMAALGLLRTEPRRVERLQRNGSILREALAGHGVPALPGESPIVCVPLGPDADPGAIARRLLERGLFVSGDSAGPHAPALRLTVMASHAKGELRQAAEVVGAVVPDSVRRAAARRVARGTPAAGRVFDGLADAA
jgi:7-keto-8-aminopelargonate synthetase-like enzyme